jgi:hypothetical protein
MYLIPGSLLQRSDGQHQGRLLVSEIASST